MLMAISLVDTTDTYSSQFLDGYMSINVLPEIKRVTGVGEAFQMASDYSMRIWLQPDKMAQYNLMPSDITAALSDQNIEAAPGSFGENGHQSFEYDLRYKGRLSTPQQFDSIVVRTDGDNVLYLTDVAKVELGSLMYSFKSTANGHPGSSMMIMQSAGSNAFDVINNILAKMDQMKKELPKGMTFVVPMNTNVFLSASIHEVEKTLIEAFILVFLVVYIFLQDLRSTIIPAIAIPVALIGTFALLYLLDFSINLLTLSALVLAIAIVVDDAIVVVEAVHAKLDEGYHSARQAAIDAMAEIGSAIVSITLVMMLVFHGLCYRHLGHQCLDAVAGLVRSVPQASQERGRRARRGRQAQALAPPLAGEPFSRRFQQELRQAAGRVSPLRAILHSHQVAGSGHCGCGDCRSHLLDEYYLDWFCAQ